MSVILFDIAEVYQEMATAYEGLKHMLYQSEDDRVAFYKALRRMYFANVAAYLCQYHDDSPLSDKELASIDTVQDIPTHPSPAGVNELARLYIRAWRSLKYNTVTNDGESFRAEDSYQLLQSIGEQMASMALGV